MQTVLWQKKEPLGGSAEAFWRLLPLLPYAVGDELRRLTDGTGVEQIDLHAGGVSSLTRMGRTECLSHTLTGSEAQALVEKLCDGSSYAFADTIRQGYITLSGGIRVGVCGRLRRDGDRILGVSEVNSLCFRLPGRPLGDADPIVRLLDSHPGQGVLIWAPPGVGKTSYLRAVIARMGRPPLSRRIAVVDTREELAAGLPLGGLCVHWLYGYERGRGIEIATRTLSAELIICDEIGQVGEAGAMLEALGAGVPLLATAHGGTLRQVVCRPGVRLLVENGVFGSYVGIKRAGNGQFSLQVASAAEAGRVL